MHAAFTLILVEIKITCYFAVESKCYRWKSLFCRVASKVGYRDARPINGLPSRLPDSPTEIHVFEVIKELLIKSPQLFQQICANQNETTRHPVNLSLGFALPTLIDIRYKPIR